MNLLLSTNQERLDSGRSSVVRVIPARYAAAKRLLDIGGALVFLALSFPIMLIIAFAISVSSRGPILFRQARLGRHGRIFWLFKFRTMDPDAEQKLQRSEDLRLRFEAGFKMADDPRITPLGALLRKTSLDELPQFINVLAGDMSLIGPRPIVPAELAKYGDCGEKLLSVKPGLGGLWQVSGRSNTTYSERILLDMDYIDRSSLLLDLSLLLRTAFSVLTCRGSF